jgi:hypothetical protein
MRRVTVDDALLVDPEVKSRRVRMLVTIVLVGTLASIAYHYVMLYYLGRGYPESTFLFRPEDHFNDWDNLYLGAQALLRGDPVMFAYFPFAVLTSIASTVLPMRLGFAIVIALFLIVLVLILRRWVVDCEQHLLTKIQYAFILVVLSYPVIFALDRTNMEILIFVFLAGFFYFLYVREVPWLAALFLAAAIAFKLYPATLLVLLLAERRFKTLGLTVAFTIALTAISLVGISLLSHQSLSETWRENTGGKVDYYQQDQVTAGRGLQHGHTLWGAIRTPAFLAGDAMADWQTKLYIMAAGLIFLALAAYAVLRETERWKLVLLATAPALLLPFVSADYTLIQMYFPLVFFLNAPRASRWDVWYVVLFAVLLIPSDYYYVSLLYDGISISVFIYPIALLALLVLAVIDRAPRTITAGGSANTT